MKKKITFYLVLLFIFSKKLNSQATFWFESFGTGCSQGLLANGTPATFTNGAWGVTSISFPPGNGPLDNNWFISATEAGKTVGSCGEGCLTNAGLTNRTLHISNGFGGPNTDTNAVYLASGNSSTNKRAESNVINCSLHNNIVFSFKYLASNSVSDFGESLYFDGTSWSSLGVLATSIGSCSPKGLWVAQSYTLPISADGNPNVRIGFRWQNSSVGSTTTSVAIDDITLAAPQVTTGINSINLSRLNVKLFPNPVNDILIIEFEKNNIDQITISNILGQALFVLNDPLSKQEIDLSSFSRGIYFITLQNGSMRKVFKIVKE